MYVKYNLEEIKRIISRRGLSLCFHPSCKERIYHMDLCYHHSHQFVETTCYTWTDIEEELKKKQDRIARILKLYHKG